MTTGMDAEPALVEILRGVNSPWRIHAEEKLQTMPADFSPPQSDGDPDSLSYKKQLTVNRRHIRELQGPLYAGKQYSILLIFQALDAAGKDGGIREVLQGLDPAGVNVAAFKQPTKRELAHDFLWRTGLELPERGNITAFNRSYYEEVLTVRVHPEFLQAQYGGEAPDADSLWVQRYRAIREYERHLASAHTVVLKFWLNVSPKRQAKRFMDRIQDPSKQWKFSARDVTEAELRGHYDEAVLDMFNETSRPWAPWFCIPADDRWYLPEQIADIFRQTMTRLPLRYPSAKLPVGEERDQLMQMMERKLDTAPTDS